MLLNFYAEGKKGKSIILKTPEGDFLSPKAVDNAKTEAYEEGVSDALHGNIQSMKSITIKETLNIPTVVRNHLKKEILKNLHDAWFIEGNNPEYHRKMQDKLRREWGSLYFAVRNLFDS